MVMAMNLEDKIKWIFLRKVVEEMEEDREDGWHVTQLVYECLRVAYYSKLYAELIANIEGMDDSVISGMDEETLLTLWIGKKLHEMPVSNVIHGSVVMHEYPVKYEVGDVKIVGRIDEVLEVDGELIICDKKTVRTMPSKPYEHHVKQVNMYSALLYAQDGIKVNKGAILYIDVVNKQSKVYTFALEPDKDKVIFEMEMKVRKLQKALKERKPPEPKPTWYCGWCRWFIKCVKDGFEMKSGERKDLSEYLLVDNEHEEGLMKFRRKQ